MKSDMQIPVTSASRERLDLTITTMANAGAVHLVPVLQAVRDCQVDFLLVPQDETPFTVPAPAFTPWFALIGDDTTRANGPQGFCQNSLGHLFAAASGVVILSSAPDPAIYATAAALPAIGRRNVVFVETRPEQESNWANFAKRFAPSAPLLIGTVKAGSA